MADQSGSTGSQALAIILRGIILGDLESGKEKALIRKKALLGLLNGGLVGLIAAICMHAVVTVQYLPSALMLGVAVLFAMVGGCIISGNCGAIVLLVLKRFGVACHCTVCIRFG